jgi:hypothetical protein
MPRAWYIFNGSSDIDAQYAAGNYRSMNNGNKPACVNGLQICAIYCSYTGAKGIHPTIPLSRNITQYITDAFGTQVSQPQFPSNTKRYVYLKSSLL